MKAAGPPVAVTGVIGPRVVVEDPEALTGVIGDKPSDVAIGVTGGRAVVVSPGSKLLIEATGGRLPDVVAGDIDGRVVVLVTGVVTGGTGGKVVDGVVGVKELIVGGVVTGGTGGKVVDGVVGVNELIVGGVVTVGVVKAVDGVVGVVNVVEGGVVLQLEVDVDQGLDVHGGSVVEYNGQIG
uniref:Uncharacterized protein n=1 Tax=Bursaphelenchus xylophilus TaxID=6326 RepID=A0A1I7SDM1_BURXY